MLAKRLISTVDLEKTEWLKIRKSGLSGTNISAIAGVNKYASPISIYLEKISEDVEETPDNEYMYFGRKLESFVAEEFKERHPELKIQRINAVLQHPEFEWVIGDIDRFIKDKYGNEGVLEIKTGTEYAIKDWEGESIPDAYMIQLQWYMFLTGCKFGYFAALLGGHRYIEKYVERDDELIKYLFQIAKDFWFNKVLKRLPPKMDGTESSEEVLKLMYPQAKPNTEIELPPDVEYLVIEREELTAKIKELENQMFEKENQIKDALKDNEKGIAGDYIITWKNMNGKTTTDTKRLFKDHPGLESKYSKTGAMYRTFKISKIKGGK